MTALRIGTRGSPLALWQARAVQTAITKAGESSADIITIRTTGDRLTRAVLADVGGKSVFVKEIEDALLDGKIDLAVHSAKDLPADIPDGLAIVAALPRADPRDAIVLPRRGPEKPPEFSEVDADRQTASTESAQDVMRRLTSHPRVGTGSVRRVAQLVRRFPDARFTQIRGNVGTRLEKLDDGAYDVLVLAAAGLERLGLAQRISARLSVEECVPSPGQGIVAIETRVDDERTRSALAAVNDAPSIAALDAERAVLSALGGDCQVPIGAIAVHDGAHMVVRAIVTATDGATLLKREARGPAPEARAIGQQVATALIAAGAAELIAAGRADSGIS